MALVGRSVQVPSPIFKMRDWKDNVDKQARAYIIDFPTKKELSKHKGALSYIQLGEDLKINKGYKTSIRAEWQIIPSLRKSAALFIRRNNLYPKLVINEAGAYTTDTMHRVTPKNGINLQALTASYYNSLSLAFSEISGRSHGGGVLELMPSEVEDILLPYDLNNSKLLPRIEKSLRSKVEMKELLAFTDDQILGKNLGFTKQEIKMFNKIWLKLQKRRLYRD